jgi:LysR family transcriptional regulator, cys regulon transcriptional activator
MTLQQLRYLCTIVDESFSITKAAARLRKSQPGLSKQLRLLERELHTALLTRRRNRVTGLTSEGSAILPTARQILKSAETLKEILADAGDPKKGRMVIATTHVHARYTLLPVFKKFRRKYPRVIIHLLQGRPDEIGYWVSTGEADIGLGTLPGDLAPTLLSIPCFSLRHSLITPARHPLLAQRRPSLEAIARYPFITTNPGSRLGNLISERFASRGLQPDIVIRAVDIEIIKTYVELGFGIAIVPTIAIDPRRETGLRSIDVTHIFEPTITYAIVQSDVQQRSYINDFIAMLAPRRENSDKARGRLPRLVRSAR